MALAAATAATLLSGCGKKAAPAAPPLVVDAAAATRQNLATYLTLDGQIAPLEQSTLAFQQSGTILKINVNIGDMVHKGELLATIDPRTIQASARSSARAGGAVFGGRARLRRRISGSSSN